MKNEIIQNLSNVITALNGITVCGKHNLNNLAGSISILEQINDALNVLDIIDPKAVAAKEKPAKKN